MRLAVSDISVDVGRRRILGPLSFEFPARGLVAVIGPNGSGKSTLLDAIGGFLSTSTGRIAIGDANKAIGQRERRRHSARLHQVLVVPEDLSVHAYLGLVHARIQGGLLTKPFRADDAYAELAHSRPILHDVLATADAVRSGIPIARLSWGQKRLVALAAVVAATKPILLLDEPTAGLAKSARDGIARVIGAERECRLVVMVEHDIDAVTLLADHVLVIRAGRLAALYGRSELTRERLIRNWWEMAE